MQECAWLNIFIYFTLFKNRTIFKMALQVNKKKPSDKDSLIYLTTAITIYFFNFFFWRIRPISIFLVHTGVSG